MDISESKLEKTTTNTAEPAYTKAQILTFVRYQHRRDLLTALLDDDRTYTHAEIESAIDKFMRGGK